MVNWHRLANPIVFLKYSRSVLPWLALLTLMLMVVGLYLSLFVAPPDYQQGDTVRIMFMHVPSAWMALLVYTTMALASAAGLISNFPPGKDFCFIEKVN